MENINKFFEEISFHNRYNQIAYKFFVCYSRFEYSLKMAGYIHTPNGQTFPQASLIDYARTMDQTIDLNDQIIKEQIDYIVNYPPNELHIFNTQLQWFPLIPQSRSIDFIFRCMRTVRNNLFHGNKQLPGNSIQRNIDLISSFLPVIDYLIEQNQEVKNYFLSTLEN